MCMNNINTNVVFFNGINNSSEQLDLLNVCKGIPKVKARRSLNDNNVLIIDNLSFVLSINANEKLDLKDEKNSNPLNTFVFNEDYEIVCRLTETTSGDFMDLGHFDVSPTKESEYLNKLCRNIYSRNFICSFDNARVKVPPTDKNLCVLKINIRHKAKGTEKENTWIIQSLHPIELVFKR